MLSSIGHYLSDPTYILVSVIFLLAVWYFIFRDDKSARYPPGPRPWPIVGNILQIMKYKKDIYEVAVILRKQYGDIIRLRMGPSQNLIILLGSDKIRKAGMHPKLKYRPNHVFTINYIFKERGLFLGNGENHAALRKFALGAFREFGVGKRSLEERIQEEATMLAEVLEQQNGEPHSNMDQYKMSVCNVIAGIIYGNRFEYSDPEFADLLNDITIFFRDTSLVLPENYFPLLRFLPGSKVMKIIHLFERLEKYARRRIEEHRNSYDPDHIRDFVDLFIQHEGTESGALTEDNMFRVIVDVFNAGTETTATTLLWSILHLIRNPDVQTKCREEILRVVGSGRLIRLEDKHNTPYFQAFINEVLRFSTIGPHSAPHAALEDLEFEGYLIPKNSMVVFSLYSMLMDGDVWENPEEFRPERFLTSTGTLSTEKNDDFLPFSLGPRSCFGRNLALMEIYLFIGILIQRFEFKCPAGTPLPSVDKHATGISCRPDEYKVCAIPILR